MRQSALLPCALLLLAALPGTAADNPSRPRSARGADATTLVLYSDERSSYSLGDSLELLKMQLLRVATRLETISVAQVTPAKMAEADYLVVFCPQSHPALSSNFLQGVTLTKQPLLWVGFGAEQLKTFPQFSSEFELSAFAAPNVATNVNYRGRDWPAPLAPWIPASLPTNSHAKVVLTIRDAATGTIPSRPLCWQLGNFTIFAGIPQNGLIGFLFEDLLLDFYQVNEIPASRLFIRVEDYHAHSDHQEFRRIADFLNSRHIPFLIAVVPRSRDPETGKTADLDSEPEFANALRYAQQRGGRVILKGFTYGSTEPEFWNIEQDRPLAGEQGQKLQERLHQVVHQMFKHGVYPLAWETPHYAASHAAYTEVAHVFSTAVERFQLSDSTQLDRGVTAGLTLDRYDRFLIPENMDFLLDADSNALAGIRARGEVITRLRGSIGGCYFFAYQPLEKLIGLVDTLDRFKMAYLDLADLDNVVQLPDALLLTGHAQRTVTFTNAAVSWKAFDRSGKRMAEEKAPATSSGARLLKRRGVGDYELFESVP